MTCVLKICRVGSCCFVNNTSLVNKNLKLQQVSKYVLEMLPEIRKCDTDVGVVGEYHSCNWA